MSHFVLNYHDTWADLRRGVKAARADYLRKVENATPYLPSEKAQEDIETARADYEAALEAARAIARPKFARAIEGMRGRVAPSDMTAPTAEQLALLQMLDLRDGIEAGEVESAARAMGGNDAALRTLRDILLRKGTAMPQGVKTFEAQARDAVDALQGAADSLLAWDGRDSQQVMSDYMKARNEHRWGSGDVPSHSALASCQAADIEAAGSYMDTARAILGDVPTSIISALE